LLEDWVRQHAKEGAVILTIEQRKLVEESIRDLAQRYRWSIHAIAPMRDHVHVVAGAPREGDQLREGMKAVASKWLNKKYGKRTWWAEGGSARYLWERKYFENAVAYVLRQREF
jgi:REP element-mobilizing transposase RayT